MRRLKSALVSILFVLTSLTGAAAQNYPSKPITIIVPYPVGGPFDTVTRQLAEAVRAKTGKSVIVDNKSGGRELVATRHVLQMPSDGYTLLLQSNNLSLNTLVFKDAGYSSQDFVPIVTLAKMPYVIYINQSVPANNLKELIAYSASRAEPLNIGDFGGVGNLQELTNALIAQGIKLERINYRGATDMMTALLANDIQVMVAAISAGKPHVEAGKLKAIAVTQDSRSKHFPTVPTLAELKLPKTEIVTPLALFARTGISETAKKFVRDAVTDVVASKDFRDRLDLIGFEPWELNEELTSAYFRNDFSFWQERFRTDPTLVRN